jgi:hypothetical protein
MRFDWLFSFRGLPDRVSKAGRFEESGSTSGARVPSCRGNTVTEHPMRTT